MSSKTIVCASALILMMSQPWVVYAQEAKTIQGEVIDPALYLREGKHGPEAEDMIYDGVDSGQTLAILEEGTGIIYLLLAQEPGLDPNDMAYDYAGRKVKITGNVLEKGGLKGIVASNIESLEPITQTTAEDLGYEEDMY